MSITPLSSLSSSNGNDKPEPSPPQDVTTIIPTPSLVQPNVLDYSFMELKTLDRFDDNYHHHHHQATTNDDDNTTTTNNNNNTSLTHTSTNNSSSSSSSSSPITTIRMRSNSLSTLSSLPTYLTHTSPLPTPPPFSNIRFFDVSLNHLSSSSSSSSPLAPLSQCFPHLSVLYLHGNNLSHFRDIRPLAQLTQLTNVTLHGNPIEKEKCYRMRVLCLLPKLIKLDFSVVTKREVEDVGTWKRIFGKRLAEGGRRREEEEG